MGDEKGLEGTGEGVVDLDASMGEANPGLLYGGQPSHRGRTVFRGKRCGLIHLVGQSVEARRSDSGVHLGGEGVVDR